MSTEKMREEFESAVLRNWPKAPLNRCDVVSSRAGQYADEIVQRAWWGWQASRAALVIELPAAPFGENSYETAVFSEGTKHMRNLCSNAIEAQGMKVKP